MGTQVLLDILSAMFIGGIMVLTLQRVNQNVLSNYYYYGSDFFLQRSMLDLIDILETDLKRIGYTANPALIPTPTQAIRTADSSAITFVGDVDADGDVDTVAYTIGLTSEMRESKNPRDRILYKTVNNSPRFMLNTNITQFKFDYFDVFGTKIDTPIPAGETGAISTIQISIEVESPDAIEESYAQAYWRQVRLAAKNLQNR